MKVLVVDDSAVMRLRISQILAGGGFEVHTARSGAEALAQMPRVAPDVVTLDLRMPEMDGLACLRRIMAEQPTPVVIISSLSRGDAPETLGALKLGAVDYIQKPGGAATTDLQDVARSILSKVSSAARARPRPGAARPHHLLRGPANLSRAAGQGAPPRSLKTADSLVLVGASTGGPSMLEEVLGGLREDFPLPVLVCQHMPATITPHFAQRLNQICNLPVQEVRRSTVLEPGHIYIGRGDADLVVIERGGRLLATCLPAEPRIPWHPSVGRMVQSAMRHVVAKDIIGVMLTGMGDDGAEEMAALRAAGGRTIAESQESCVVFGMPQALIARDGADVVLPGHCIAQQVASWAFEIASREALTAEARP